MPNWCENNINIYGEKEDIKKFITETMSKEDDDTLILDFNKIMPMPDEIKRVSSPVNILSLYEYNEQEKRIKNGENIFSRGITQKMSDNLKAKYKYDNWYDWAINNWGTKWSLSEMDYDISDNFVNMTFFTAWGPPTGIYKVLVKKFPELSISWHYNEPGMDLHGNLEDMICVS